MNIAILGPQGSGKGTQAHLLSEKHNFERIETGKILREISTSNSPEAQEIKKVLNEGKLVSDETLQKIIQDKLDEIKGQNIVFDGTPRNIVQYMLIKNILKERGLLLDKIIFLKIPKEETLKRLSNRRTCEKCNKIYNLITNPPQFPDKCECGGSLIQREDDTKEAIWKRLAEYERATVPVLDLAKEENLLNEIDGTKNIEGIFENIENVLNLSNL